MLNAQALPPPPSSFRTIKGRSAQWSPKHVGTEPIASPAVPSPSMQAVLATINGSIQPYGFLSHGHRNAWSQWEGERLAGCVFINQPSCPVVGSDAVPAWAFGPGPQLRQSRGLSGPAKGRQPGPLSQAGTRQQPAAWVPSLLPPRDTEESGGYRGISDVVL